MACFPAAKLRFLSTAVRARYGTRSVMPAISTKVFFLSRDSLFGLRRFSHGEKADIVGEAS
jgi:hypothetical protein